MLFFVIHISLLDLASQAEMVSVWDENDFTLYQEKRKNTVTYPLELGYLRQEVIEKQKTQSDKLLIKMDSLYENNLLQIQISKFFKQVDELLTKPVPDFVNRIQHKASFDFKHKNFFIH
ncbi:hypothetical protein [Parabacteroides pacaensis]|uniref:hypothetical protein n=1 Tax=Parabacteroides pacaensis TaxID=2086575 RepID=UPI000D0F8F97|nr:hypothetical protein [Parabacteroides pacaensis]